MIFEATNDELQDPNHFFGANYDIFNGIYNGTTYEVSCLVSATRGATMRFQLWIHDTTGSSSVKEPEQPKTPSANREEFKIVFTANETNRIRIHLHCMGGRGRIEVEKVTVIKIK